MWVDKVIALPPTHGGGCLSLGWQWLVYNLISSALKIQPNQPISYKSVACNFSKAGCSLVSSIPVLPLWAASCGLGWPTSRFHPSLPACTHTLSVQHPPRLQSHVLPSSFVFL